MYSFLNISFVYKKNFFTLAFREVWLFSALAQELFSGLTSIKTSLSKFKTPIKSPAQIAIRSAKPI